MKNKVFNPFMHEFLLRQKKCFISLRKRINALKCVSMHFLQNISNKFTFLYETIWPYHAFEEQTEAVKKQLIIAKHFQDSFLFTKYVSAS